MEIRQAKDFLMLAFNIVGKERKITIDTGIYKHVIGTKSEKQQLERHHDIINLIPEIGEFIELSDLLHITKHMENQFDILDDMNCNRTFFMDEFHQKNQTYTVFGGNHK
jgi:hypothetical protein